MEELNLLKKYWKKEAHSFEQVSELEIYKMLHKKSSSVVKWILIISILEALLWISVNVVFNMDEYIAKMKLTNLQLFFCLLNYFNYAVILIFIFLFYKNYVHISTTVSTKKLMTDILKARKTVQYYVAYNLTMVVMCLLLGFYLGINNNPVLKEKLSDGHHGMLVVYYILFIVVCIAVFLGVFWVFYRLLYGILLKKLYANYKELKKIDL